MLDAQGRPASEKVPNKYHNLIQIVRNTWKSYMELLSTKIDIAKDCPVCHNLHGWVKPPHPPNLVLLCEMNYDR